MNIKSETISLLLKVLVAVFVIALVADVAIWFG